VVKKYNVKFKIFEKVDVNGPNAHEVFKFLRRKSSLYNPETKEVGAIPYNFTKFLLDGNGQLVQDYNYDVSPFEIRKDIHSLLSK
jgi:glutathione peroxidase